MGGGRKKDGSAGIVHGCSRKESRNRNRSRRGGETVVWDMIGKGWEVSCCKGKDVDCRT